MVEAEVQEVAPGVFLIDHRFQGTAGIIGSYLLVEDDVLTLIEAGPSTTTEALLAGVRAVGFEPERIGKILLTHIHLDHAGAAGSLVQRLPRAKVFVHPVGAPHLIDPSKLLRSASRIYGDEMETLWGEVLPVPEERIVVLEDEEMVPLGGRSLRALDTPGHAFHHYAYHDEERGTVFTGDVAAVRLAGSDYVRPPTPPPELDLERWRESIARLRALRPARLCLTHFGSYTDVDWHLDDLLARLFFWGGWVDARLEAGASTGAIAREMQQRGDVELREATGAAAMTTPYELATNYEMTVDGYARYFRKLRGEGSTG